MMRLRFIAAKCFYVVTGLKIMPWHRSSFWKKLLSLIKNKTDFRKDPKIQDPGVSGKQSYISIFLIFVYFILQSAFCPSFKKKQDKIVQLKQQD